MFDAGAVIIQSVSHTRDYPKVNLLGPAIAGFLLLSAPVAAQSGPPPQATSDPAQAAIYGRCLVEARNQPQAAYDEALRWFEAGGGLPARHCAAVALISLKAFAEGASRLERLATEVEDSRQDLRIGLLTQAAQAWLLAGRAERAERLQSLVVTALPEDPEIRIDRAITRLGLKQYWEAIEDLDAALDFGVPDPEIYLYRAVAYRSLDVLDLASDDLDRALALDGDHPEVWLERGVLARKAGDREGARTAWLTVLRLVPNGRAADVARAQLEALDVAQ